MIRRYHAGADRADQPDMITLSFAVALGFAAIENLSYLLAFGDWALLAASRALTAVPVHGLNGLAMGSFLAAAQLHPRNRHLWLTFALVVPVLLHAVYDFPLILVARNQMFFGVLPAWFLFIVLCSVCILWLSNNVRASVERAKGLFDATSTAWRTGVMLLLLVPALSAVALVGAGDFGILDAAACSILPVIFGVDLLYTRPKVSRATTAKL